MQEELTRKIRGDQQFFSIIADEATDQYANQEILSVCLRFLDWHNEIPHISEVFYDFITLERTTGKEIAASILSSLQDLDPSLLRGQAYDGASVMSGGRNGVQALIKQTPPKAMYTHCSSHLLNLSVAASCKDQEVRNVIDVINEIYRFLNNSPKRQRFFERVLKVHTPLQKSHHLVGMCKTRWVERHTCLQSYMELHECLSIFLDAITHPADHEDIYAKIDDDGNLNIEDWKWDRDTKVKAQGFQAIISSFGHICSFVIAKSCLEPVKPLAAKLQKRDQDIITAYQNIDSVIDEIKNMRRTIDTIFPEWYETAINMAEKVGSTISIPRRASRQTQRSNTPADTPSEYYKRVVAIPMLDSLQIQMGERFSQDNRQAMKIFGLVPTVVNKEIPCETVKCVTNGAAFWEDDLPSPDSLSAEIRRWCQFWQAKQESNEEIPDNFLKALVFADVDFFPNIRILLTIGCTLPITSVEAERSFSALKRTKTYLRSTMGEERLTSLVLMNVHYGLAKKMNTRSC